MARTGIAPLSTTIPLTFPSGSSTTSQRPIPKKISKPRRRLPVPIAQKTPSARERRGTAMGLFRVAIENGRMLSRSADVVNPLRPDMILRWARQWRYASWRAVSWLVVRSGLDGCPERFRYFAGDVVLDHQDVVEWPVVGFRPDNVPAVCTNQPRVHAQAGALLALAGVG